jgi:hypothetical protein
MRVCQTDALCFINKTGLTIRWQDLFRGEPMVSPAGFFPAVPNGLKDVGFCPVTSTGLTENKLGPVAHRRLYV